MGDRQSAGRPGAALRPGELRLGRISGVFGVRGEVRVHLYNRDSEFFRRPADVDLLAPDGSRRSVRLTCRSGAGKRILGRIDGVSDRDQADALVDHEIVLEARRLPVAAPGEYYHHQILGLAVQSASGDAIGRLVEIYETGDHDTWIVRGEGVEIYVPALSGVVLQVDLGSGVIVIADDAARVL